MSKDTYQGFWEDLKSGKFASMVKESSKGQTVSNANEVYNILKPIFEEHDDVETIYGIFLDAKNHIITIEKLFSGSITAATVYPREIVKKVLGHKAAAIVLVHNHPSGDISPSFEDREITGRVGFVLHAMGVALHDHIIVGNGFHSMADAGCLKMAQKRFQEILNGFLTYKGCP
jgi:DNA repair protein RadC